MKRKILFVVLFTVVVSFNVSWANTEHTISFSKSDVSFFAKAGFTGVKLKNCLFTDEVGAPQLPIKSVSLLIPKDVKVTGVRLVSVEKQLISGDYFVYPAQERVPYGETVPFVEPNSKIYESEESYPAKVIEVAGDGFMNGYHIAGILVYPLEYIPAKRELYLYTSIVFEVRYESELRNYLKDRRENFNAFKKKLETVVDNPQAIDSYEPSPAYFKSTMVPSDSFPYVIITTETLSPAFELLAEWKTKKGTPTKIEYLSNILAVYSEGDDAEKIRNFIDSTYTHYHTDWILLGGDVDIIPSRYVWTTMYKGHYILSDFYYCCLDGNWNADGDTLWGEPRVDSVDLLPEVSVGRIPVSDLNTAQAVVNKLFSYEKESPNYDYQTKALFLSSEMFEDSDGVVYCDTLIDHFPAHFYIEGPWYQYESDTGIVKMNEGYGIIYNISHSQVPWNFLASYCPTKQINDTDIDTLSNIDRYSVMLGVTCNNNQLDNNCVGRHFINNSEGGGISFIASSRYDYPHASEAMNLEFFDRLFDSEPLTIGEDLNLAKIPIRWRAEGVCAERTLTFSYLLLGDPEMKMWTNTPLDLNLDCPSAIDTGLNSFDIVVRQGASYVWDAIVCLMKDDEVYEIEYTRVPPDAGEAWFRDIDFPTPGWASIVASKKNYYIPAVDSIPIGYPARPGNISATAWACHSIVLQWDDSSCNEQGFQIMRKEHHDTAWAQIATVDYNVESFNDTNVDTNHIYYYKIRAFNDLGYSDYSDIVDDMDSLCEEPGCPFVYIWNGQGFVNENVILTGSEDEFSDKLSMIDYYLLSQSMESKDSKYELEIREYENEVSKIDKARLFSVEYPLDKKIGVTPEGKVWIYSDPTSPISCIDQNGVDHLDEIAAKDKNYFSSKKPGYLIVNYGKLNNPGLPKPSGQMGSGGGGGFDPPPKQPQKLAPPGIESKANIVYIDIIGENGDWTNIAKVYPRTRPVQTLVELSQYVDPNEDFKIKISWEYSYSADHIAYYRFDDTQLVITELLMFSAVHSDQGDINTLLNTSDNQRVELSPDQTIKLSFSALPEDSSKQRGFLFVAKGYYEKLIIPSDQPPDMARINTPNIAQNYPNPFNLSTEIRFTLPDDAKVTLNIYNILGQKVTTLVNGEKQAGTHSIYWDGRDKSGSEVASGIYFYQLKAGEHKKLKKMLLIK